MMNMNVAQRLISEILITKAQAAKPKPSLKEIFISLKSGPIWILDSSDFKILFEFGTIDFTKSIKKFAEKLSQEFVQSIFKYKTTVHRVRAWFSGIGCFFKK